MELRHLRCFMAVAEELHFARAAERLHIEQSPLSRAIKELEEDLGAQLFVRTTRSTRLTRAGRMFLEHGSRAPVGNTHTALNRATIAMAVVPAFVRWPWWAWVTGPTRLTAPLNVRPAWQHATQHC